MRRFLAACLVVLTPAAVLAQPPVSNIEDRVVVTGMVPVPDVGEGAPLFTAEDMKVLEKETRKTATESRADLRRCGVPGDLQNCDLSGSLNSMLACEVEYADRAANLAGKAAEATEAAETARTAAARGEADMAAVEATELVRQEAVRRLQEMRAKLLDAQATVGEYQDAALGQGRRLSPAGAAVRRRQLATRRQELAVQQHDEHPSLSLMAPQQFENLAVMNVTAREVTDRKGMRVVMLSGELVNRGSKAETIPSLQGALYDERGWTLVSVTVSAPGTRKQIAAGKTQAFQMEIRPAPQTAHRAVVTFASKPRMDIRLFCQ